MSMKRIRRAWVAMIDSFRFPVPPPDLHWSPPTPKRTAVKTRPSMPVLPATISVDDPGIPRLETLTEPDKALRREIRRTERLLHDQGV